VNTTPASMTSLKSSRQRIETTVIKLDDDVTDDVTSVDCRRISAKQLKLNV